MHCYFDVNIKTMAYTTKYKYVWADGYWYSTKRRVSTTYYVPKTIGSGFQVIDMVGDGYQWIPGHYELRVKWVKKTTEFWLTTWHYKKGYWKKSPTKFKFQHQPKQQK